MAKTPVVTAAEAKQKKGERLVLLAFVVGAVAIGFGMGLISSFLSNNAENRIPFLVGFAVLAVIAVPLYLLGQRARSV
ncbi:MAG: hypothetical protein AABX89_03965 [Candidatus Thermoplasmatota archaeon]|mgnify:CR=1 FL=1